MEEKIVQANFQTEKLFKKFLRTSIVLIVLGVVISCIEYMFDSYAQYVYNSFFKFFYYSMTSPYRRIKWDIIAYPIYIGLLGIPLSYIFKSIINKRTNIVFSTLYKHFYSAQIGYTLNKHFHGNFQSVFLCFVYHILCAWAFPVP